MKPAELKTIIERLGLNNAWVAQAAGVKNRRSVEYWVSGKNHPTRGVAQVPSDVAALLESIDATLWVAAEQAVDVVAEQAKEQGARGEVLLVRYRTDDDLWQAHPDMAAQALPTTCHAVLLSRTQWLLKKAGFEAVIDYAAE